METLFTPLKALPLLLPSLAWMLGLVLSRTVLSVSLWLELLCLVVPLILFFFWRKLWLIFLSAGLLFGAVTLEFQKQNMQVDASWLGQKIQVQARIQSILTSPQYTRLRLSHVRSLDGQLLPAKIDVYLYHQSSKLLPDMKVALTVKLHKPHNKQNPAYFDYESYLFEQDVVLMGSVSGKVQVLDANTSWLTQWRQKVRGSLLRLDVETRGVLLALLLADKSKIPLPIYDAFAASGAAHLLAISGLHVGLVAAWGFMLMWWLITRREAWIIRFPVRTVALSVGILLTFAYATLAGWPIPAQRAFWMLLAGVLAWALRARQVPLNTLFAALFLITLFNPSSVLSVSLYLSFIATAALLIWANQGDAVEAGLASKAWVWFKGMLLVSMVASLATLPLIGFVFERLPVWGLLANALLLPVYALWVLPLALLGELLAVLNLSTWAEQLFSWSAFGISWGNDVLLWLQTLPWGSVWLRSDKPWLFISLALSLLLVGLWWLQHKKRHAIFLLCSSLVVYAWVLTSESKPQPALYVWDVGQGASALLALPEFTLLVDAPGKHGSQFNGGSIAAQNMRRLGLLHADAVVLSHAQSDHAGGLSRLMANLNGVQALWLADVPENHVYFKKVLPHHDVRWLKRGDSFEIGAGHNVQVLWPPQGYAPSNSNNASLVLLLNLNTGQRLLFAGDMEAPVERELEHGLAPVDIMLMPHHGSKTSSTAEFVKAVHPKIVVAQTGYKNHYGFPKAEVVQRYQAVGSEIYNTANGYVKIKLTAQ